MFDIKLGLKVLRENVKVAPETPGVYRMLDENGAVLYVGKAKNIKKRIVAYTRIEQLTIRLQRMVAEVRKMEFIIVENENRRLRTKEDGGMKSTMLQNPSDPEATFRNKAGKEHRGYAANLEESVGADGSVVTEYQYEQNNHSDSQFI